MSATAAGAPLREHRVAWWAFRLVSTAAWVLATALPPAQPPVRIVGSVQCVSATAMPAFNSSSLSKVTRKCISCRTKQRAPAADNGGRGRGYGARYQQRA